MAGNREKGVTAELRPGWFRSRGGLGRPFCGCHQFPVQFLQAEVLADPLFQRERADLVHPYGAIDPICRVLGPEVKIPGSFFQPGVVSSPDELIIHGLQGHARCHDRYNYPT
uniref:Uncharacterized protein n=1 Tax=Solibacter usitatus (strain Ellin6076) TaxID=234267 RepID=Q027W5_SOLUE